MPDDSFQLPRSSYDELRNIIVAYGHLSEPGSLQDVSEYGGMSTTTVSRNNGFLISTGVLEAGKKKALTKPGTRLADAIEHDIPSEVAKRWQDIIAESDFLQKILAAVKIRKGMERSALESHVAYTAGEKKTTRVMTGASTVIDILMEAGLLTQEDGKLVVDQEAPPDLREPAEDEPRRDQFADSKGVPPTTTAQLTSKLAEGVQVNINIDISVQCGVEDLDDVGKQLRGILDEVQGRTEGESAEDSLPGEV